MSHALPHLLHLLDLSNVGGIQGSLVNTLSALQTRYRHTVVNAAAAPAVESYVHRLAAIGVPVLESAPRPAPVPLGALRRLGRVARTVRVFALLPRLRPDVVLLWSVRPRPPFIRAAHRLGSRVIVWDRGVSWLRKPTPSVCRGFALADAILCNSHAARRMLQLRWGVTAPVDLCLNAVRPDALPTSAVERELPRDRPLRLGFVGRLVPLKGAGLVVAALQLLRRSGLNVELHIAGSGPEEAALRSLAQAAGVTDRVCFRGLVQDMAGFYRDVDLLVCPSLREPFGLVSIEAQASGCPVIVSAVDGLPETLVHQRTGLAVRPTMPLSRYADYAGSLTDVPPAVYLPHLDAVGEPQALNPADIADAVLSLASDSQRYQRMSRAAIRHARTAFSFERHVEGAAAVIDRVLQHAQGAASSQ